MDRAAAEARLLAAGLVVRDREGALRTTRRWQAAAMRAAARLMGRGEQGEDLRVPMAHALLELMPEARDEELAAMVAALLPVEAREAGAAVPGAAVARPNVERESLGSGQAV